MTGTEGVAADVEAYEGSEVEASELHGSHWISIAAANVLPKVSAGRRRWRSACDFPFYRVLYRACIHRQFV